MFTFDDRLLISFKTSSISSNDTGKKEWFSLSSLDIPIFKNRFGEKTRLYNDLFSPIVCIIFSKAVIFIYILPSTDTTDGDDVLRLHEAKIGFKISGKSLKSEVVKNEHTCGKKEENGQDSSDQ